MSCLINADNGVVSGFAGVRTTADGTGNLALQSNGVTLMTLATNNTVTISGTTSQTGNASFGNVTISGTTTGTGNLTTTGSIGAGTTSPAQMLSVGSTSNRGNVQIISSDGNGISLQTGGGSAGSGTNISFYDADTSYAAKIATSKSAGNTAALVFYTANGSAAFTERMRLASDGNLLINTTVNSSAKLTIKAPNSGSSIETTNTSGTGNYNAAVFYNNGDSFSLCGYINVSGTTTGYATSSDYRLKENIQPLTNALNTVAKLKPVDYTWTSDGTKGQGFIAHELQEVCSQAVFGVKDAVDEDNKPKYQGVDSSFLVAMLTAAIQELNAKVDAQAAEIAALKAGK